VIDIMLPFWGDAGLLLEAVRSVVAQTSPDWRLTIVDDCNPVSAEAEVAALGDPRVRYLRNEANLGLVANFRRCVQLAEADLVTVFGSDDVMLENYVATVTALAAAHPEADIIQPGVQVIDETGRVYKTLRDSVKATLVQPRLTGPTVLRGEAAAARLLWGNWLYWPSLAFRRVPLQAHDFRDGFPIILDLALLIDLVLDGSALLLDPAVCFHYRRHSASASSSASFDGVRFADERRYFNLAANLCRAKGWPKAAALARLRLLSRLDAVTAIPGAVAGRHWHGLRVLLRHLV
jgi:GT2 family glycosyltransferase